MSSHLIRNCEVPGRSGRSDVRLAGGRVARIAGHIDPAPEDDIVDAGGGALLPGLYDHHMHLVSTAASLRSVRCGPPHVHSAEQLASALAEQRTGTDWLRGIGYHPGVAGDIDRHWLDQHIPDRPVRLQHRGGRLWLLNSAGLRQLGLFDGGRENELPAGVERDNGELTGRLYECDEWLRSRLHSKLPDLGQVSAQLASYGVTGVTDTTPRNGPDQWQHFARQQAAGHLLQDVRMMGGHDLPAAADSEQLQRGEYKVHLLEAQLPETAALCLDIRRAHEDGRGVAIHCVTSAELAFAIGCLDTAGTKPGDRIEHASVTPPGLLSAIAALKLRIVTQAHFIAERGDQYLVDVTAQEQPWLYRLRGFIDSGIPLAGGSDAPFGCPDPWQAMSAAVSRGTVSGHTVAAEEALTPEQALALYTSAAAGPGVQQRTVAEGSAASVCLLTRPWREARHILDSELVAHTWNRGKLIY